MNRLHIPKGAWMRLRQHGRYAWAMNASPIIWSSKEPPKGAVVYTVAWFSGQGGLKASGTYTQP